MILEDSEKVSVFWGLVQTGELRDIQSCLTWWIDNIGVLSTDKRAYLEHRLNSLFAVWRADKEKKQLHINWLRYILKDIWFTYFIMFVLGMGMMVIMQNPAKSIFKQALLMLIPFSLFHLVRYLLHRGIVKKFKEAING